jgi:hypothetical protein
MRLTRRYGSRLLCRHVQPRADNAAFPCPAMSTLAGALDEKKPSIVPKREDNATSFKEEEDVEMDDAEYHTELKEDQEMDDLFGNDEVEEAKTVKYVIDVEAFPVSLTPQ